MFLLLGRSTINRDIELPLFDNEGQKKLLPVLEKILFRLLGEIVDPESLFSLLPTKRISARIAIISTSVTRNGL